MLTCKLEEDDEEKLNQNEFKEEKYVVSEVNSEKKKHKLIKMKRILERK